MREHQVIASLKWFSISHVCNILLNIVGELCIRENYYIYVHIPIQSCMYKYVCMYVCNGCTQLRFKFYDLLNLNYKRPIKWDRAWPCTLASFVFLSVPLSLSLSFSLILATQFQYTRTYTYFLPIVHRFYLILHPRFIVPAIGRIADLQDRCYTCNRSISTILRAQYEQ